MENRYIAVHYTLTAPMGENKEITVIEQTRPDMPFQFISGMGQVLDALEEKLAPLAEGEEFAIDLTEDEAYGPYFMEAVQSVPLEAFLIEGKLDTEHIYEGAVVPLMNAEGQTFNGTIVEIKEKEVVVDLNHPLAGKPLSFKGHVVTNHVATNQEIESYMNQGCGGCGGCGGGDCGGKEGGCGGGCGSCGGCN